MEGKDKKKKKHERRGRPMAGVVLDENVLALVDGYRKGRGLRSVSAALRELVEYALGNNHHELSAIDDYLRESPLKKKLKKTQKKAFRPPE
jgi:hypothetical protein